MCSGMPLHACGTSVRAAVDPQVSKFDLATIPAAANGNDVFEISGGGGGKAVSIKGNNGAQRVGRGWVCGHATLARRIFTPPPLAAPWRRLPHPPPSSLSHPIQLLPFRRASTGTSSTRALRKSAGGVTVQATSLICRRRCQPSTAMEPSFAW